MLVECCVWSVLCFNFVTAQKYIGLGGEFKKLQEAKKSDEERMQEVCGVCVVCVVCGVCVVCVCVCGIILAFHTGRESYAAED